MGCKRSFQVQRLQKCLKAFQIENIINYLGEKEIDDDSLKEITKDKKVILKTQQGFKSERCNAFTEEINKTAFSSNDDKRMLLIDSIKTYAHGMSKDLICKK